MKEEYAKKWRTIEEEMGREELANIIAYIRTIKKKEKARLGIYEEYQELFKDSILERGTTFIDYVKEIADVYDEKILSAELKAIDPEQENRYRVIVDLMYRFIPFSDWIPPLLAFYYKFKSDNYLLEFLLKLEKKVIIEWAAGFSGTERMTSLGKTIEMIENANDAKQAVDKIFIYIADEDTKTKGTKSRAIDFSNNEGVKKYLRDKLGDIRFYSIYAGRFAKYVLLRADMEFWELENLPVYPGTVTVEHVLPQKPAEGSDWLTLFGEKERWDWTNRLGNLVLLSGRKNSRAQNYDFNKKKDVYFKERSTPFRITQQLQDVQIWNPANLQKRHNDLIAKIVDIYFK
jgi:hypothetical protein